MQLWLVTHVRNAPDVRTLNAYGQMVKDDKHFDEPYTRHDGFLSVLRKCFKTRKAELILSGRER